MTLDPILVNIIFLGLASLISAVVGAAVTLATNRRVAKKEDVTLLQDSYAKLEGSYTAEIARLNKTVADNGDLLAKRRDEIKNLFDDQTKTWAEQLKLREENVTLNRSLVDNKAVCERQIAELREQITKLMDKLPNPAPAGAMSEAPAPAITLTTPASAGTVKVEVVNSASDPVKVIQANPPEKP